MISNHQKRLLTSLSSGYIKKYIDINDKNKIGIFNNDYIIKNISQKALTSWIKNGIIKESIIKSSQIKHWEITLLGKILIYCNYKNIFKDVSALKNENIRIISKKEYLPQQIDIKVKKVERQKSCNCCWNQLIKVNKASIGIMLKYGILQITSKATNYNNNRYNCWKVKKTLLFKQILLSIHNIHLNNRNDLKKIDISWKEWKKLPALTQEYLMREKNENSKEWLKIKNRIQQRIQDD